MNNLTPTELLVLNNLTKRLNPVVALGTLFQTAITELSGLDPAPDEIVLVSDTPVNAVSANKNLTLSGVVLNGETVTVDNPDIAGSDVYEFRTDTAQAVSDPTNIAVDIESSATKSSGTLTIDTQPTSGDTMTIGEKVYTFVPVGTDTADGEVSRGTSLATAQAAIVAAINGTDGVNNPHPLVSAGAFLADASTITALIGGVSGDSIVTTETFTAGTNVFGAGTLGGGADCSAANAVTALVAAVTASDTQGVGATDEAGDVVKFTADDGGVAGNAIAIGETLSNGAFAGGAVALSGGTDGTPGVAGQVNYDATYMYVAIAENTIAGKNWRRITLGAAY